MLPAKGAKKNVESDENLFSNFKLAHCGYVCIYIYEGEFGISNQKLTKIKFGFVSVIFLFE